MDGYYLACFIVVGGLNAIGIAICVWAIGRDALPRVPKMQRVGMREQINKAGRNPPPPKNFNKPPPTPDPPQTKRP